MVENLVSGHDETVIKMRDSIESILTVDSKRLRRTAATGSGCGGFGIFSDNVGKVITPRHNTGLVNKGQYLQMTLTLAVENRIPSSHMR